MNNFSIIQKSQLEGAHRLDAEYYQQEYLTLAQKLAELHLPKIEELGLIVDASAFYPSIAEYYNNNGDTPFIRVADVANFQLVEDGLLFLPQKIVDLYKTIQKGKPGDIIITKGGTVGNAALLPDKYLEYALSRDIIFIKTSKLSKDLAVTILLFLNSKFGTFQLLRGASQQIQLHLTFPFIRDLNVPGIPIKQAVSLYYESLSEFEKSRSLYSQAEDLLLEELGLKDFKIEDDLSFVVNLSDVKSANRIDSDFFQPKYGAIVSSFRKLAKILKNIAFRNTAIARIDPETEYKYIEISDVNTGNGEVIANIVIGKDLPANAKMKIYGGELLVSKVRPTRGAVAIIPESWNNNYVASGAFSIFNIGSPQKEYLQVVLRSAIGKLQLEKPTTGTSYPTVTDQDVENILIPILPKPTQQKIADLVRKSHEARKKSKEFLEEAKQKVEEMIEGK